MRQRMRLSRAALLAMLVLTFCFTPSVRAEENTRVMKFIGSRKGAANGHPVMLLAFESATPGGRGGELVVPNTDPTKGYDPLPGVLQVVNASKKGDLLKVEMSAEQGKPVIKSLAPFTPLPGEETPTGYVFVKSEKKEAKPPQVTVVLSKFGEEITTSIPLIKPEKTDPKQKTPDPAPDPKIVGVVDSLKAGDVVDAEVRRGSVPTLVSIEPYKPPENGKFIKMTEADAEGQKVPAVELEQDGKSLTLIVVGKLQGKKWAADSKVMGEARKLKSNSAVVYKTRQDGDKTCLKDIQPAPQAPDAAKSGAAKK